MDNTQQPRSPSRTARATLASVLALLSLFAFGLAVSPAVSGAAGDATYLYDDDIASGYENWSWGDNDTAQAAVVSDGERAVAFTPNAWEGFYIGRNDSVPLPLAGELRFDAHGGDNQGAQLNVVLTDTAGQSDAVTVDLDPGAWRTYSISLEDLGGFGAFNGVWFQEATGGSLQTVYLDDIHIVELAPPPAGEGPRLIVDLGDRTISRTVTDPGSGIASEYVISFPHAISDDIYGMNFVTDAVREELDIPVNRWGGNSTERYNFTNGSTNLGQDWFFMNAPEDQGGDDVFEMDNQADGTDTILTLPMLGWVAKDRNASCSYPTNDALGAAANAGTQDWAEPNNVDASFQCGNGYSGGNQLPAADPTITSVAADETFAAAWVAELVGTHGTAAEGGVEMYALGNEPGLWYSTHRDVRAEPIGRAELIDRNQTWAAAVKDVDPTAEVIGPVLWSGNSYYTTTDEMLAGLRPGDVPTFSAEYLAAMRDASEAAGRRLLDQFAVNFYDDRVYGDGSDELRLESTRQLWDPTYAPQDWWVARDFLKGDGSAVIPRLNTLIDQNYPGTELAITEYNFGGNDTVAGGLAQADALGIFGREGLDTGTVWDPYAFWTGLTEEEWGARPIIDAFRLYRNYDGAGSRFGDVSVYSESSSEGDVAVHAAVRSSDGALTVLLINKTRAGVESPLMIDGMAGVAERYLYDSSTGGDVQLAGTVDLTADINTVALPARSATLLVLDGSTPPNPQPEPEPEPQPEPEPEPAGPAVSDGAVRIDPPETTAEGSPLDSNSATHLWAESGPVVLDEEVRVDRVSAGSFRGTDVESAAIPAGTRVCSYYLLGDRADDRGRLTGTVTFTGESILGIIMRSRQLRDSNQLGAEGTTYVVGQMERGDRVVFEDTPTIDSVSVDMRFGAHTDAIRILTDCGSDG